MKTFKRICLHDWEITDDLGKTFKVERGKEYVTSDINSSPSIGPEPKEDHVTVFSNYWVPVPVSIFGGEKVFTDGLTEELNSHNLTL